MTKLWPVAVLMILVLCLALFSGCESRPGQVILKDTASSAQYDVVVTVESVCFDSEEKLDVAQCPSTITVYPKGDKKNPIGSIDLTIHFLADERTHMPIYGQSIHYVDMDFDGHGDLAVATQYWRDSKLFVYSVYLYDPLQKTFVHDKKLSDLFYHYHDGFKVDGERQRLVLHRKTGCCYRIWQEYIMLDGEPVSVFSRSESLMSDGEREWLEVQEGEPEVVGGDTWNYRKHEEPKPDDYGDTAREMRPGYVKGEWYFRSDKE